MDKTIILEPAYSRVVQINNHSKKVKNKEKLADRLLENATYSVMVAVSIRSSQDFKLACMLQWKVEGVEMSLRGCKESTGKFPAAASIAEALLHTDISQKPDEPKGTIRSFNRSEGSLDLFKSPVSQTEPADAPKSWTQFSLTDDTRVSVHHRQADRHRGGADNFTPGFKYSEIKLIKSENWMTADIPWFHCGKNCRTNEKLSFSPFMFSDKSGGAFAFSALGICCV